MPAEPDTSVQDRLAAIEADVELLQQAKAAKNIERRDYIAELKPLREEEAQFRRQLIHLVGPAVPSDDLDWDQLTLAQRRTLIARHIEHVIIEPVPVQQRGRHSTFAAELHVVWR